MGSLCSGTGELAGMPVHLFFAGNDQIYLLEKALCHGEFPDVRGHAFGSIAADSF
jgi:hypothetical protein